MPSLVTLAIGLLVDLGHQKAGPFEIGEVLGGKVSCLSGVTTANADEGQKGNPGEWKLGRGWGGWGGALMTCIKEQFPAQPQIPHPHPGTVNLQGSRPRSSHVSTQARNAEFMYHLLLLKCQHLF